MFHEKHPDVGIELNVSRRPYSFNGDQEIQDAPKTWLWKDGLCIYMRGQLMGVLSQCGISERQYMSFGTAAGMRSVLDSGDPQIPAAIKIAVKALWGKDIDCWEVAGQMEKAEAEGQTGQAARNTTVLALDRVLGSGAPAYMVGLGQSVTHNPIAFNTDVEFEFQPVDSQRMLQWAARFGKQEEVVSALANLHFERQQSATKRSTLMKAVERAGLDTTAFKKFLDTDDLVADVWKSYGDTIRKHGIHSIPLFIFNGPLTNGGVFRDGSESATVIHGSGKPQQFVAAFEEVFQRNRKVVQAALPVTSAPIACTSLATPSTPTGVTTQAQEREKTAGRKGLKKGFLL